MATTTCDASEQDSSNPGDHNGTLEREDRREGLRASRQEPGDHVKMDEHREPGEVTREEKPVSADNEPRGSPGTDGDVRLEAKGEPEASVLEKRHEEKSSGSARAADVTSELKREQREESVPSPGECGASKREECVHKAGHGAKRRASVEMSSSDGEPLSRVDSEDRFEHRAPAAQS